MITGDAKYQEQELALYDALAGNGIVLQPLVYRFPDFAFGARVIDDSAVWRFRPAGKSVREPREVACAVERVDEIRDLIDDR